MDSFRASTMMTIDELGGGNEQNQNGDTLRVEREHVLPTTAKTKHRVRPRSAASAPPQRLAQRPGSTVPCHSGRDALRGQNDVWHKQLQLRPSKRFDKDAFDRFLERQATQIENRLHLASSFSNMAGVERLMARGLLEKTSRAATNLLSHRKDNTPSFAEFLSRQDVAAKNRLVRSRKGPTPSTQIRKKVKQQGDGDFEAFLARQAAAEARALERCKVPVMSASESSGGWDFDSFWERQEAYSSKWEDSVHRVSQEMLAAAKPPDFVSLIVKSRR